MFPMIEMAGREHAKHIERLMYIYNNGNRDSYMYRTSQEQKQCYHELTKQRKHYSRKTKKELL